MGHGKVGKGEREKGKTVKEAAEKKTVEKMSNEENKERKSRERGKKEREKQQKALKGYGRNKQTNKKALKSTINHPGTKQYKDDILRADPAAQHGKRCYRHISGQ